MRRLLAITLFAAGWYAAPAAAQPSLAGEDGDSQLTVTLDGNTEAISVMRDARVPDKWYYVPNKPRLAVERVNGKDRPAVALTMFQFPHPTDAAKEESGGWLTMSVTLALPPDALDNLRQKIEAKHNAGRPVLLDAVPLTGAKAYFFTDAPPPKEAGAGPGTGRFVVESYGGQDNAPRFATQQVTFSTFLSKNGADLLAAGLQNNQLPVWTMLEFQGVAPKLGFTVTGDWSAFFNHYSTDTKFAARASYFGLFGGSAQVSSASVKEELVKCGGIKIDAVTGEAFKQEDVDRYLQPVVKMLLDGIAEDFKPPAVVAAVADPAKAGGFFFGAGFSRATKSIGTRKTTTFTMSFGTRSLITAAPTWASATLGIKGRPADDHITWVKNQLWEAAYLKLPDVPTSNELGVTAVDVTAVLKGGNRQIGKQAVMSWSHDKPGWRDERGQASAPYVFFPLRGFGVQAKDLDGAKFHVTTKVTRGARPPALLASEVREFKSEVPAVNGTVPVSGPWEGFQVAALDGSALSFERLEPGTKLTQIYYDATVDGKDVSGTLKPYSDNGKWVAPPARYWLVGKDSRQPIQLKITPEIDGRPQPPVAVRVGLGQAAVSLDDRVWKLPRP